MAPQPQTRFVVLEGLDGAGTTTQAALLAEALHARDQRVCLTSEPTDGPLGRVARAHVRGEITLDPHTAALAFLADRADHLERVIRPALREGAWVVCDRYLLSTLAYQGAEGVDPEWILGVAAAFEVPGLTVYLDVPPEVRGARLARRAALDRYEGPGLGDGLRAAYRRGIEALRARGHRILELDGTQDPARLRDRILAELQPLP